MHSKMTLHPLSWRLPRVEKELRPSHKSSWLGRNASKGKLSRSASRSIRPRLVRSKSTKRTAESGCSGLELLPTEVLRHVFSAPLMRTHDLLNVCLTSQRLYAVASDIRDSQRRQYWIFMWATYKDYASAFQDLLALYNKINPRCERCVMHPKPERIQATMNLALAREVRENPTVNDPAFSLLLLYTR